MTDPARVLVVDDETTLATVIAGYLTREGFVVDLAHDGPGAVDSARANVPDLVVLDVMLPGFDGIEVCRRLREFTDAYVIMLTARDEEIDKIVGLSGAAANAHQPVPAPKFTFADIEVDLDAREVNRAGTPVDLTRTEFDLLACMAARPRTAFSRRQLLDEVWGQGWFGDEHVVDVHVAHLRAKLEDDAAEPVYIRTVRGIGYGLSTP